MKISTYFNLKKIAFAETICGNMVVGFVTLPLIVDFVSQFLEFFKMDFTIYFDFIIKVPTLGYSRLSIYYTNPVPTYDIQ